jgi:toxin CcdB
MPQFDIYPNPQPVSRQFVPYLVDVQSDLIDQLPTRFVMPLSRVGAVQTRLPVNLCLTVEIDGEPLSLLAHMAAPVSARLLKKPVGSLRYRAREVSAALDAVISGF